MGYLGSANERAEGDPRRDAFVRGLRDLGYIPRKNIILDVRGWTTEDQLRQALSEFLRINADVIFVGTAPAARVAQQATRDIPIVCGPCGDPVDNGLAASLARPGGSVTALASQSAELIAKRVELLRELLPGLSGIAAFVFPANPGTAATLKVLVTTAHTLGVEMQQVDIRRAPELEDAFRAAANRGAGAVVVQDDPLLLPGRTQIADPSGAESQSPPGASQNGLYVA